VRKRLHDCVMASWMHPFQTTPSSDPKISKYVSVVEYQKVLGSGVRFVYLAR